MLILLIVLGLYLTVMLLRLPAEIMEAKYIHDALLESRRYQRLVGSPLRDVVPRVFVGMLCAPVTLAVAGLLLSPRVFFLPDDDDELDEDVELILRRVADWEITSSD